MYERNLLDVSYSYSPEFSALGFGISADLHASVLIDFWVDVQLPTVSRIFTIELVNPFSADQVLMTGDRVSVQTFTATYSNYGFQSEPDISEMEIG